MTGRTLIFPLLGLLYAAGTGWLLYWGYGDFADLLHGNWLKAISPGAADFIPIGRLHDLHILAIPAYVAVGLWLAEKIWETVCGRLTAGAHSD